MTTRSRLLVLPPAAAVAWLLLGAAGETGPPAPAAPPPAMLDLRIEGGRLTLPMDELVERVALPEGQARLVVPLGRDAHHSHHLVAIREGEEPHRHPTNDLLVVILRGYGTMQLGDEERPVGRGSILYVPRGTLHAFRNRSPEPAVAYAFYTPPIAPAS